MALKAIVEKIEEVPEALRSEYTEKDGKFILNVEGAEDVSGLKKSLETTRRERTKFENELKEQKKLWEGLGKTPEEIRELIAGAEEAERVRLEQAGQWDKLKSQMNTKHQEELEAEKRRTAAKDGEIKAMKTTLETHLIDAQATAAIAAQKGEPILLLPTVQRFTRVEEKGGRYSVVVVDAKGDPRVDGQGNPLTIDALVAELKGDPIYGRAFDASGNMGSGMRPSGGSSGGPGGQSKINRRSDLKNESERAAFINEHGLDTYKALPL